MVKRTVGIILIAAIYIFVFWILPFLTNMANPILLIVMLHTIVGSCIGLAWLIA